MPQLDQLIWVNLCYSNTLFFWVIYYIIIRIILVKSNVMFYLRNGIKENTFLNTYIKINSLYNFNFNFITNELVNTYIYNKKRYLISILSSFCKYKDKINNLIFILSNTHNKNKYLFNNYIYNNLYYLSVLQNISFNSKINNTINNNKDDIDNIKDN